MIEYWNLLEIINKLARVNHAQKLNFYKMYPLNEMEDDCLKTKHDKIIILKITNLKLFFDQMVMEIQLIVQLLLIKECLKLNSSADHENR
jgi:hypothetical protein